MAQAECEIITFPKPFAASAPSPQRDRAEFDELLFDIGELTRHSESAIKALNERVQRLKQLHAEQVR